MNPQPPATDPLTRRDDLAAVIRDAHISSSQPAMNEESLLDATRTFIAALEQDKIPHVLVGGLALLQHVDGRNTRDIDLIIALEDIDRLPGFKLNERNEWFGSGEVGPLRVDLLFTANPLFKEIAEKHAEKRDFQGTSLRCATPEGIMLLKLFALPSLYRQGQIKKAAIYETDILMLQADHPAEEETMLKQLESHMPASDIRALRDVLTDIRKRLEKNNRFSND